MDQTLLPLLNPQHPLLVRLRHHALGTYVHSLMVGQMASFAAIVLAGVDPLLTFLGGQYHDVGKIFRSDVYAENAFLHTRKKQNFSKNQSFIASHPSRSLALAKKYNIPLSVQAFMVSHHGTTVAFKHSQSVKQPTFRYAGPKPKTMEEVLVMLADSCEASFRSHLAFYTKLSHCEKMCARVIQGKMKEGQLSEVVVTASMLRTIAKRFALFLAATLHHRKI